MHLFGRQFNNSKPQVSDGVNGSSYAHCPVNLNAEFIAGVTFSVKMPMAEGSDWVAGNSSLGADDWVVNKFWFIAVFKDGNNYRMEVLGTGC